MVFNRTGKKKRKKLKLLPKKKRKINKARLCKKQLLDFGAQKKTTLYGHPRHTEVQKNRNDMSMRIFKTDAATLASYF